MWGTLECPFLHSLNGQMKSCWVRQYTYRPETEQTQAMVAYDSFVAVGY